MTDDQQARKMVDASSGRDPAVLPPPWRRWARPRGGWSLSLVPDLSGQTAVVTGAGRGIGLVAAEYLARHGAHVLTLCTAAEDDGRTAASALRQRGQGVDNVPCDLAELAQVRRAARDIFNLTGGRLDILVNNAGVAALPPTRSADGHEAHFAINHLGHFALTGHLLPALLNAPQPRVVNVTSVLHWLGRFRADQAATPRRYHRWTAYFDSKLANLLFTRGLHAFAEARDLPLRSIAAHPGLVSTTLGSRALRADARHLEARVLERLQARWHSPQQAALSLLRAATDPCIGSGDLLGPGGRWECSGPPVLTRAARRATDPGATERLWQLSQHLTGHPFPTDGPRPTRDRGENE
ncbi:SDR family NAD(P)-dependent oxidoreductase [Streptomyces sp. CB02414]|uniref:SDR family NAD(P)-dependent oxidoreductase n=1 Tax=Streptomyces sp. CB02414 TaxID=1703922 RepID=UPI0013014318|nr:SDR family NAD(P)-dependent oxidoreductase [Streptomyces sp. CB02414]